MSPDLQAVKLTLRNEGDHDEMIGVYLDVIPPGGISNPGGCVPASRILETALFMEAGKQTKVAADTGTLGDGLVEFSCTNQAEVAGLTYTIVAAADVHADDLAACGEGALQGDACASALADDDTDNTDNQAIRSAPRVRGP